MFQNVEVRANALKKLATAIFRSFESRPVWWALLACLLWSGVAQAQDRGDIRGGGYWDEQAAVLFQHLGREHGLPSDIITAIAQDGAGFIWVGTPVGLARFDGYRFHVFRPDPHDPASLPDGYINALHVDRAGRLWVATNTGGIVRYVPDTEGFARYAIATGGQTQTTVERIAEDGRGNLWLASRSGVIRLNIASGATESFSLDSQEHAVAGQGIGISALSVDGDGTLWVGTDAGLVYCHAGDEVFSDAASLLQRAGEAGDTGIAALLNDDRGRLWIATRTGAVISHEPVSGAVRRYAITPATGREAPHPVIHAFQDLPPSGNGAPVDRLWMATAPGGLLELDVLSGTVRAIRHDPALTNSLSGETIHATLRDRAGLIWIATWGAGLNVHNPRNTGILSVFYLTDGTDGQTPALVRSAMTTRDGEVWLGLEGQGIERVEMATGRQRRLVPGRGVAAGLPKAPVLTMAEDAQGDIWIGTPQGLARYDRRSGQVRPAPLPAGLDLLPIFDILPMDNALWLASDGLIRYEPASGAITRYRHDPEDDSSLTDDRVHVLAAAKDGSIWIGTQNGLHLLDVQKGRLRRVQNRSWDLRSLAHNYITALRHDAHGRLWVGTLGGGISVLDGSETDPKFRFRQVNSRNGLPGDSVQSLVLGSDNRIWASTENGLARIDPETMTVRTFGNNEGVGVRSAAADAAAALPDGSLLFGGREGFIIARPDLLHDWNYHPPLVVTELRIDNEPAPAAALNNGVAAVGTQVPTAPVQVTLPPRSRTLAVSFAALDFAGPENVHYAYHLSGFDEGWVQASAHSRTAVYTNLSPGDYVLRLRATNKDGVWNPSIRSVAIKVLPAWYQTLWAQAGAVLLGVGLIGLLIQARTAALRRQRRRLEKQVAERTQDLMQANAELQRLASTDPLTGLLNRRRFDELAAAEIERARRYGRPLSLLLLDLDHFKRINDMHGHNVGDVALKETARRLLAAVRSTDRVARYGGEEMAVLLPETHGHEAQELAERVRRAIGDLPVSHEVLLLRVTASLGVGEFQMSDADLTDLLGRTDAALYQAKQQGRDRVVYAGQTEPVAASG
jgi:diguanylate cyclase (GGDEF)-like protein